MKKLISFLLVSLISLSFIFAMGSSDNAITMMRCYYAEQIIDSEIFKQMVEAHTDYKVDVKVTSGGSPISIAALKQGEVQIVPTQTGTLYSSIFGYEWTPGLNDEYIWEKIQEGASNNGYNVTTLNGVNFPWIVAANTDFCNKYGIKTVEDLAKVNGVKISVCPGGLDRQDGLGANDLVRYYGLNPSEVTLLSENVSYEAVSKGEMDISIAGLAILRYPNTVRLEESFYPQFYNCYAWKNLPEVVVAELNKLEGAFTTEEYQAIIDRIDKEDPVELVAELLNSKGLL